MLLLLPAALAFESEPQDVTLLDDAELFTSVEMSTGYLPSGSPIAVEFRIDAVGGAAVAMEGQGDMTWPDALTLQMTGEPGSGMYALDTSLDAVTSVMIDLSDYGYTWSSEIDRRSLVMDGYTTFDPFLLDDRVEITDTPASLEVINYEFEVITGLELDFTADMSVVLNAGFEGVSWTLDDAIATAEDESLLLQSERVADYTVPGVFRGYYDAYLDVVVTPTLSACIIVVGCWDIATFDIPISLLSDNVEQDFEGQMYVFPLPLLVPGLDAADFGDVDVGDIANVQIPLANDGSLEAYGSAAVVGEGEFTVYPSTFNALPDTEDGVVVTFAPTVEGPQTASLVLTSNDPTLPDLEIPLTGNGAALESDDGGQYEDDEEVKASTSTCGCSGGAGLPGLAVALLAASMSWRRRRV
ncbi:MAG: hypothetical protein ACOZNI_28245 [Myxococcota bacterium]